MPSAAAAVQPAPVTADVLLGDVLEGGDVVPGWKLPLRELFA